LRRAVDAKGRQIPSVRAVPVSDSDQERIAHSTRSEEDALLLALLEPDRSVAQLAVACGWTLKDGTPHKSKVHRRLAGLQRAGLAKQNRGSWELTEKGKTAAAKARQGR
jgi:hypothetical protein